MQSISGANSNSQRMDNAEKYPNVVEHFSSSLLNSKSTKSVGKKSKSKFLKSLGRPEFKPDPRNPTNSLRAYVCYWVAVFLFQGQIFKADRDDLHKAMVRMTKHVANDVKKVFDKKSCTDWITFSRELLRSKYSANALHREYILFFSQIRNMIHQMVKIKVGNRKWKKTDQQIRVSSKFEELLKTEQVNKNYTVKDLIKYWVNQYAKHQFTRNIDEFVDNLMLLIPYTYLIYLKRTQSQLITEWDLSQFLEQIRRMDSMNTDELLDAVSPADEELDLTNPMFFTSRMLERPRIFINGYVHHLAKFTELNHDFYLAKLVIRVKSDQKISLFYATIFNVSFYEKAETHRYPDFVFSGGDGSRKQTIFNFISRWAERRNYSGFSGFLTFYAYLLMKFSSMKEGPEFWNEKMNEPNETLRCHYYWIKTACIDGGFDYSRVKDKVTIEEFANDWKKRLELDHYVFQESDVNDFRDYLNKFRR